ncbi:uncharacterized protein J3R85_014275 [Psidium guajava]|nr:uncharacterized protein J3R85_014275 [Psidium guajava]
MDDSRNTVPPNPELDSEARSSEELLRITSISLQCYQGSSSASLLLHANDASKAFAFKHVVEGLVDLRERDPMSYELLHFKLLEHLRLGINFIQDESKE